MSCTAQVGHIACSIIELVGGHGLVAIVGVRIGVVGDGVVHGDLLGADHSVGVGVDGDVVIALFEHVCLGILVIIGSHVIVFEFDGHVLGSARLKLLGLLEANQVGTGLFDATFGVRRVVVDLNNILASGVAGVGDGHINGDLAILVRHIVELLLEGGVAQTVTERECNHGIVIDGTFGRCGLIELVAHIDAFGVVHKARDGGDFVTSEARVLGGLVFHVGVFELAEVVVRHRLGEILQEGVGSLAGRVGIAGKHVTECGEAGLACRRAPHDGFDLRIVVQEVELEGVGAVVDERDLVEVLGDQVEHIALGLAQLQEAFAVLEVLVILGVVLIGDAFGLHVHRKVSALATDAGEHYNSLIGEALGIGDQGIGILVGRNLRQGPILCPHANNWAICTVIGVQLGQVGVGLDAGFLHAIKQGNGVILVRHGAGAGAAVYRVGGAPTEHVDLLVSQRQVGIIVLQHGDGFRLHFLGQLVGLGNSGVRQHVLGDGRVVEQRRQRTGQHHGNRDDNADQSHKPRLGMDDLTGRHFLHRLLVDGKSNDQREHK